MVWGIVNEKYSGLSPIDVHTIEMLYELDDKVNEGNAIVFALAESEVKSTLTTACSNQANAIQT